jgi:hypothetical protein
LSIGGVVPELEEIFVDFTASIVSGMVLAAVRAFGFLG